MERRTAAWLLAAFLLFLIIAALLYGVIQAHDQGKRDADRCGELIRRGLTCE